MAACILIGNGTDHSVLGHGSYSETEWGRRVPPELFELNPYEPKALKVTWHPDGTAPGCAAVVKYTQVLQFPGEWCVWLREPHEHLQPFPSTHRLYSPPDAQMVKDGYVHFYGLRAEEFGAE